MNYSLSEHDLAQVSVFPVEVAFRFIFRPLFEAVFSAKVAKKNSMAEDCHFFVVI